MLAPASGSCALSDEFQVVSGASAHLPDAGANILGDAVDGSPGCPDPTAGPTMVNIGSFCIDSTEVTADQYMQFLTAKGGDVSGQPLACASWNRSFVPVGWPSGAGAQAVSGVNWCMAFMYCAWAGKRLCGSPSGGPLHPPGSDGPAQREWVSS